MAFDAAQAVADKLTHLDDQIKQAESKRDKDAADNDAAVKALVEERDAWQALLDGSDEKPARKTAKKAASKGAK